MRHNAATPLAFRALSAGNHSVLHERVACTKARVSELVAEAIGRHNYMHQLSGLLNDVEA